MVRSPAPWIALALSQLVPAGLFAALFAHPSTDDYAGWAVAVALAGLPASLTILRDRDPISALGIACLALPAAAALGGAAASIVFLVPLPVIHLLAIWLVVAPGLALAAAIALALRLRGQATRDAGRRVLAVVALPAAIGAIVSVRGWWGIWGASGFDRSFQEVALLIGALPLAWIAGPAAVWLAAPRRPSFPG